MRSKYLIGRTLGNFEIKRLIGRGGMAEVYYGMDIKLHRPVAIKVFEAETQAQIAQANRFLQEARMMAQWRHDNIVQIYYAGDATGLFYYVMEYIDGYDLASIMSVYADKGELMPFADVLRIGNAIASALDYAHSQGVIHRDVKPANVMIANDGRVVLGDFGLALDLRDKSRGEVFGSPHYISPEQARRSSDAVPQSDLYSLGVILYEMLTGATPFNDPSPATLALQHITEAPPPPRTVNPGLSEKVEEVLLKALEKNPADRYQSGREMLAALEAALVPKPATALVDAPPLPPIPVGAPTVQRSDVSLNSFTKRQDVITALEKKSTADQRLFDGDVPISQSPSKTRTGWLIAFGILLLMAVLLWLKPGHLSALFPQRPSASTLPVAGTETNQSAIQIIFTDTPSLKPTLTQIVIEPVIAATQTMTPSATATLTQTAVPTDTATATQTPTESAPPTLTVKYANGYLITAFYNESSFYILDQGQASRSAAGFSFERINNDGTFENHFGGWEWGETFKVIPPTYCFNLELDPAPVQYLNPVKCDKRVLSNISLSPGSDKVFWTPNDTSHEFRVLWLDEEIARCEIAAGTCDFYVP